jgi:hypothetical protein
MPGYTKSSSILFNGGSMQQHIGLEHAIFTSRHITKMLIMASMSIVDEACGAVVVTN